MQIRPSLFTIALCVFTLLGCDRVLLTDRGEADALQITFEAVPSPHRPAARAQDACATVFDRVRLLVDNQLREEADLDGGEQEVTFEAVVVREGQQLQGELLGASGALLYAAEQPVTGALLELGRTLIALTAQQPVLKVCPDTLTLVLDSSNDQYTGELEIRNIGRDTLDWTLEVPLTNGIEFSPSSGRVAETEIDTVAFFWGRSPPQSVTAIVQGEEEEVEVLIRIQ